MEDTDHALAIAVAENSCSSQDDDFQLPSLSGQLFMLNKFTFSHSSKRQKKDRLSTRKAPSQIIEHVSKAGKENQKPSRRRDGSKGCATSLNLLQARRPLQTRKQNVTNIDYSELATKKGSRKRKLGDEALGDTFMKPPDKEEHTRNLASRLSNDSPEKLSKQATVSLTSLHLVAVDDACRKISGSSADEHCDKYEDKILVGSQSLALDDASVSPSRSSALEHHRKHTDETLQASPCFAMDVVCITASEPPLHGHSPKTACGILRNSQFIAGDDALTCLADFSSSQHDLEHLDLSRPSSHEHYTKADETLIKSPKGAEDDGTPEMHRQAQCFCKDDALQHSPNAHDRQQEETVKANSFSPILSQIPLPKHLVCNDGNAFLDDTDCCDTTFSSMRLIGETVSLAEEDDLVIDVRILKQQPECYLAGNPLTDDCFPSATINSESQFSALLQLCVDAVSDSDEEKEPKEESFSDHGNLEEGFSKAEEAITSLSTQTRFRNSVASSDFCLSRKEEKLSTPQVSLRCHEGNDAIFSTSASYKTSLETKCEEADIGEMISNAGTQIWKEPNLKQCRSTLECPVCGSCITNLSLEEREVHTNACIDTMDTEEAHADLGFANVDNDQASKDELQKCENFSLDLTPVLKWLETLNLSRYASIFVREEIDWDTLKCLTDEDLSTLGITALGPRRKIIHALKQLEMGAGENSSNITHQEVEGNQQAESDTSGKKLITDFFDLPPGVQKKNAPQTVVQPSSKEKGRSSGGAAARKRILTELSGLPEWMSIPGTKFCVDAFQHLKADCSHWFLTHFHTDHYQGLTRGFRYGLVYCSHITARLVNTRIGVPWERLKSLPLNERVEIDGVKVTLIDANHCPGSVMILFEPPNGKAVLHTGDFRFCEAMANSSVLQACNIHTLMLDTTYCNPQYDFPKQEVVIQFIIDAIQAEAFNPSTLFLIGTYTIGKERIFLEVAKVLRKKIYCCATKLRLLQCMNLPDEDMKWLTTDDNDSHIHVVPLWSIASFKRMNYISRRTHGRYNSIVSFSPTGWSFGRGKKRTPGRRWQQGTIVRYEVPYSEHCSFNELKEFVRFINPVDIVPSVNNDSSEAADAMVALLLNEEDN